MASFRVRKQVFITGLVLIGLAVVAVLGVRWWQDAQEAELGKPAPGFVLPADDEAAEPDPAEDPPATAPAEPEEQGAGLPAE